jgi:hypothetical protein
VSFVAVVANTSQATAVCFTRTTSCPMCAYILHVAPYCSRPRLLRNRSKKLVPTRFHFRHSR